MVRGIIRTTLIPLVAVLLFLPTAVQAFPAEIVILRHGDKNPGEPWNHNLDEAGLKRSLALPSVLLGRFGTPKAIFVPRPKAPDGGNIRSLQLITPTAVEAKVNIDTQFSVGDETQLAEVLQSDATLSGGTVFVVWEHKAIPDLMAALGVKGPKKWKSDDFDSLWIVKYRDGTPEFSEDHEGLN